MINWRPSKVCSWVKLFLWSYLMGVCYLKRKQLPDFPREKASTAVYLSQEGLNILQRVWKEDPKSLFLFDFWFQKLRNVIIRHHLTVKLKHFGAANTPSEAWVWRKCQCVSLIFGFSPLCFEPCCFWIHQEWRCSKFTNIVLYYAFWVIHKLPSFCPYSWSLFIPFFFAFTVLLTTLELEALVWRARMVRMEPRVHNQHKAGNLGVFREDLIVRQVVCCVNYSWVNGSYEIDFLRSLAFFLACVLFGIIICHCGIVAIWSSGNK